MIPLCFVLPLAIIGRVSCLINTHNTYLSKPSFFRTSHPNLLNQKHRINKPTGLSTWSISNNSPLFINTPLYTFSKFKNHNFELTSNDLEQAGLATLPEESNSVDLTTSDSTDEIQYPIQSSILSPEQQTEVPQSQQRSRIILKEVVKDETTPVTTCQLVKSSSLEKGVSKFFSRAEIKTKIQTIKNDLKAIKELFKLFLYPRGASDEVVKYTNWKILERLSLALSSAMALNTKPMTFELNENQTEESNWLKSKLSGAKMSTAVFTIIFKDLFSRLLNYYWFNNVIRLSDNPKTYRVLSTLCFSLVTLWDFFINAMAFEPKTLLLAFNHVLKQLFLGSHNVLNQLYYNRKSEPQPVIQMQLKSNYLSESNKFSELNDTELDCNQSHSMDGTKSEQSEQSEQSFDSQKSDLTSNTNTTTQSQNSKDLKTEPLYQFKDESNFVFDLMGMALGTYTSYLLNTYNSYEVKLLSLAASLLTSNLLTAYVTTLVDK